MHEVWETVVMRSVHVKVSIFFYFFVIPSKPISFLLYPAFLFLSFLINFQRVTLENAIYQQFA